MPMKVCIDCGTIFPAEHIGAKRCCLCAAKHGTEPTAEKVYPKPPVDDLTRDVRQADASVSPTVSGGPVFCWRSRKPGKRWK